MSHLRKFCEVNNRFLDFGQEGADVFRFLATYKRIARSVLEQHKENLKIEQKEDSSPFLTHRVGKVKRLPCFYAHVLITIGFAHAHLWRLGTCIDNT